MASDFESEMDKAEREVAGFITAGMNKATVGLKLEYRDQVIGAGLGQRLANTWRGKTYPEGGKSLTPAAFVWTNAPQIIDAFNRGAAIRPMGGSNFLWIPTDNVPRDRNAPRGSTRRAGPEEVELQFNQELIIRRGKNGHFLAFINAIKSRNKKGWRQATKGRLRQGRETELVLMFTLVPSVHMPKELDVEGPAGRWAAKVPSLIEEGWS